MRFKKTSIVRSIVITDETSFYFPRRNSDVSPAVFDILHDDCAGADDAICADVHVVAHGGADANVGEVADAYRAAELCYRRHMDEVSDGVIMLDDSAGVDDAVVAHGGADVDDGVCHHDGAFADAGVEGELRRGVDEGNPVHVKFFGDDLSGGVVADAYDEIGFAVVQLFNVANDSYDGEADAITRCRVVDEAYFIVTVLKGVVCDHSAVAASANDNQSVHG